MADQTEESKQDNLDEVTPELEALRSGYTASHRMIEILFLIAICITVPWLLWKVWGITNTTKVEYLPGILVAAWILGVVAADVGSGIVHWAADNWGSVEMPVLGESMIRSFRQHHIAPQDMVAHDFIELNGNSALFAQIPVAFGFVCLWLPAPLAVFFGVWGAIIGACTVFTNQIHAWAHSDNPPGFAVVLQNLRIILPADNHALHHAKPYDRHYCITTGWCNPLFRKIRFFESLEWCFTKMTGIRPEHDHIEERMRASAQTPTPPPTESLPSV